MGACEATGLGRSATCSPCNYARQCGPPRIADPSSAKPLRSITHERFEGGERRMVLNELALIAIRWPGCADPGSLARHVRVPRGDTAHAHPNVPTRQAQALHAWAGAGSRLSTYTPKRPPSPRLFAPAPSGIKRRAGRLERPRPDTRLHPLTGDYGHNTGCLSHREPADAGAQRR